MTFEFTKMQALGNDFVVVGEEVRLDPELIVAMCDRHFGIGADGVLRVSGLGQAITMEYWNADGSPAEMCGNGLRCVARFAVGRGMSHSSSFTVFTPAGPRRVEIEGDAVTVDLGPVEVGEPIEIGGREYVTASVGNPHAVTFVDDPSAFDVGGVGALVSRHAAFPAGTNVEFVAERGSDRIEMRVWERGVGETLACGSGMVAAAAVAMRRGAGRRLEVSVPGGVAHVELDGTVARLRGPADVVFVGTWVSGPS